MQLVCSHSGIYINTGQYELGIAGVESDAPALSKTTRGKNALELDENKTKHKRTAADAGVITENQQSTVAASTHCTVQSSCVCVS